MEKFVFVRAKWRKSKSTKMFIQSLSSIHIINFFREKLSMLECIRFPYIFYQVTEQAVTESTSPAVYQYR